MNDENEGGEWRREGNSVPELARADEEWQQVSPIKQRLLLLDLDIFRHLSPLYCHCIEKKRRLSVANIA